MKKEDPHATPHNKNVHSHHGNDQVPDMKIENEPPKPQAQEEIKSLPLKDYETLAARLQELEGLREKFLFSAADFEYAKKRNPNMLKILRERRKLDPEIEKGMDEIFAEYLKEIQAKRPKEETDKEDEVPNVGVDVMSKTTGKAAKAQKK